MIKTVYVESGGRWPCAPQGWWYYYLIPSGGSIEAIHYEGGRKFTRRIMVMSGDFDSRKKLVTKRSDLTYWENLSEVDYYWHKRQHTWQLTTYREYKSYPVDLMTLLLQSKVGGERDER
jgi:hypothetical protein